MPKITEPTTSSTGTNEISLKDIFDAVQRSESILSEIRHQITRVNVKNEKLTKQIETLNRTLTQMKIGTGSVTLVTKDFGSVLTDNESSEKR
jgi:predicted  nucleic acid-binding Zn-ribbon protein